MGGFYLFAYLNPGGDIFFCGRAVDLFSENKLEWRKSQRFPPDVCDSLNSSVSS